MPLYEFECQKCHHQFEELVSASSAESPTCPKCKGTEVRKKVSAGAVHSSGTSTASAGVSAPTCAPSGG